MTRRRSLTIGSVAATLAACLLCTGCQPRLPERDIATHGFPQAGRDAIARYGCGACHAIGGVPGAHGTVGPTLKGLGDRAYLAGHVPNMPDGLIAWIQHPQTLDPRTAMPDLGVNETDARNIAAYLLNAPR
jgi:cytochrome c1